MSRLNATPWARNALGIEAMEAIRTRIPVGHTLDVAGRTPNGPWRVVLLRGHDVLYDETHADLKGTVGAALAWVEVLMRD